MAVAFMGTTFFLNKNAGAQSGLTEVASSQSFISQKITIQLNRLDQLKQKINGNIFSNPIFQSLKDFSQPLPTEEKGRDNPFAPVGQ
jgi:hypothetical protein